MSHKMWTFDNDCDAPDSEGKESVSAIALRILKSRKIVISSDVNSKLADKIIGNLILMEEDNTEKPIIIYINSPGGEVYSGFAIYDWIQSLNSPVYTVVSGFAASMGSILSLSGNDGHKYAMPNAKILIHQPLVSGVIRGTSTEIQIHAKEMLKIKDRIVQLYADKTGKTFDTVKKDIERDYWMTSAEAKEYGLIDKIITKQSEIGL